MTNIVEVEIPLKDRQKEMKRRMKATRKAGFKKWLREEAKDAKVLGALLQFGLEAAYKARAAK